MMLFLKKKRKWKQVHVYLWQIHFDIWQNQYNIVKLNKIKFKKKKENKYSHYKQNLCRKMEISVQIFLIQYLAFLTQWVVE